MNVFQATNKRISYLFDEFEQVVISFSGGKDSGVMLNAVLDYAKENDLLGKVSVYHMDYEAQYQYTTDYVTRVFNSLPLEVKKYWVCLPIKAQCSTSMYQSYWQPWKKEDSNIWVRQLPEGSINEHNQQFDFDYQINDYDFNLKFGKWLSKEKSTCFCIGIRTQESLHRYAAIHSIKKKNSYKGVKWTTKINSNFCNAYPIFDWETSDVWTANGRFKWDYNKLYDIMYQAGLTIHQMRVASPFNDSASESLKLYKIIEPNTWGKLVSRVNGVNFTSIYGGTTAMGWRSITKPPNHTWESYMYFLLDTLPAKAKESYTIKLETSIKFWKEKGGVLSKETIQKLNDRDIDIVVGTKTNYKTEKKPVQMDYLDDIDIQEFKDIPTFKRMCVCIMKNDHFCKYMGFSQTKKEAERRKNIMNKYKNLL